MNKRKFGYIAYAGIVAVLLLFALITGMDARKMTGQKERNAGTAQGEKKLFIGDTPIGDYVILARGAASAPAEHLNDYVEMVSGERLKMQSFGSAEKYIKVVKDTAMAPGQPGIEMTGGDVTISGCNGEEIEKQVRIFANAYLGIAFAGEDREHVLKQDGNEIHVPAQTRNKRMVYGEEAASEANPGPWNEKREPIICLWKTDAPRGVTQNPATSLKCELLSYSDDQLYAYVKMMKNIGYTGIQVTDMCSAWAYYGNYEFVHDRIRFMADAAHSLGMDFTLWVWGA